MKMHPVVGLRALIPISLENKILMKTDLVPFGCLYAT